MNEFLSNQVITWNQILLYWIMLYVNFLYQTLAHEKV